MNPRKFIERIFLNDEISSRLVRYLASVVLLSLRRNDEQIFDTALGKSLSNTTPSLTATTAILITFITGLEHNIHFLSDFHIPEQACGNRESKFLFKPFHWLF